MVAIHLKLTEAEKIEIQAEHDRYNAEHASVSLNGWILWVLGRYIAEQRAGRLTEPSSVPQWSPGPDDRRKR